MGKKLNIGFEPNGIAKMSPEDKEIAKRQRSGTSEYRQIAKLFADTKVHPAKLKIDTNADVGQFRNLSTSINSALKELKSPVRVIPRIIDSEGNIASDIIDNQSYTYYLMEKTEEVEDKE